MFPQETITVQHTIAIPNYIPPRANALFRKKRHQRLQLESECKELIRGYSFHVPRATTPRRVTMVVTLGPRLHVPDADESL